MILEYLGGIETHNFGFGVCLLHRDFRIPRRDWNIPIDCWDENPDREILEYLGGIETILPKAEAG